MIRNNCHNFLVGGGIPFKMDGVHHVMHYEHVVVYHFKFPWTNVQNAIVIPVVSACV